MSDRRDWKTLIQGKGVKCPVCGNDHVCQIATDGAAVICFRVEAGCAKRRDGTPIAMKSGMGWLHRLDEKGRAAVASSARRLPSGEKAKPLSRPEIELLIKQHRTAINPQRLDHLAESLGVSVASLKAYGIGWDTRTGAWSFPMFGGDAKPCGIRLRGDDGRKFCVPGSKNGLFVPNEYNPSPIPEGVAVDEWPLLLLTPEGPTDCAAAWDLGFRAIGRPSCSAGADQLHLLLAEERRKGQQQDVVIVADNDETKWAPDGSPFWPGIEGSVSLARKILPSCGRLRWMFPPGRAKDLRVFKVGGGTISGLIEAMAAATRIDGSWFKRVSEYLRVKKKVASLMVARGIEKHAAIQKTMDLLNDWRSGLNSEDIAKGKYAWVHTAEEWIKRADARLAERRKAG